MSASYLFSESLIHAGFGLFFTCWGIAKLCQAGHLYHLSCSETQQVPIIIYQEPDCCRRRAPEEDCDEEDEITPVEGESKDE